jgi:hypothetical protein
MSEEEVIGDERVQTLDEYLNSQAKLELDTAIRFCDSQAVVCGTTDQAGSRHNTSGRFVNLADVLAALLETYERAQDIGWETKALDSFSDLIRRANSSN